MQIDKAITIKSYNRLDYDKQLTRTINNLKMFDFDFKIIEPSDNGDKYGFVARVYVIFSKRLKRRR